MPATWLCALALTTLAAQDPDPPVIVRYQCEGKPAIISRDDLAEELCRRYGRTEHGQRSLAFLIDLELTRRAAAAARRAAEPSRDRGVDRPTSSSAWRRRV